MWGFFFFFLRNEKNQLLLGIRRAVRPQTVMPSSVLSSDSMHLGLLAAAAHAAATNSRFTIFYNPRYGSLHQFIKCYCSCTHLLPLKISIILIDLGLVHRNLSYHWPNL